MDTTRLTAEELVGRTLLGQNGHEVGPVTDIYIDDDGKPQWLLVDAGVFKGFQSIIPVSDIVVGDQGLTVDYSPEKITGAPQAMVGKQYAKHREGSLYDYYKLTAPEGVPGAGHSGSGPELLKPPSELCLLSTKVCDVQEVEFKKE